MGTHVGLAARTPLPASERWPHLDALRASARLPLTDRRFWITQAMIFSIVLLHESIEMFGFVPSLGMLYFVPTALFFMPVVYAAINFGLRGSLATALWCTMITTPNWVLWHDGFERYAEAAQMGFVWAFALMVGLRVDEERKAYARVEMVSRALERSEQRYRQLFEAAREGILVLDEAGRIVECNSAARALMQGSSAAAEHGRLGDVFPAEAAAQIMAQVAHPEERPGAIRLRTPAGEEAWVEPVCTRLHGDDPGTQVLLRDVTRQQRRQENLETYTAQVHRAQEDERRRIAQEIHDDTVQSLVMLCRELDEVEGQCGERPAAATAGIRGARDHAEEIMGTLRVLIRDIRPPALDDLGLVPAVQRLLTDVAARADVRTELVVAGAVRRAPRAVELAMLRIVQEALRNAERHAAPAHIDVRVTYAAGHVELEVRDDGAGFVPPQDPSDLARPGKWGIIGMHERAREVGGELRVSSTPGAGTTVQAAFGI
jgi:PAS domain S-box-containing protein